QEEVAPVDQDAGGVADDENRIEPVDRINEDDHAAGYGEEPKGDRDDAFPGALAGDPLHQEPAEKHRLADQAECDPYLFSRNRHASCSTLNGLRRRRRRSHHTPKRSGMPTASRSMMP